MRPLSILLLAGLLAAPAAFAQDASVWDALRDGTPVVDFRLRHEMVTVDTDTDMEDAQATTFRTLLGYRSGAYNGFSIYAEAEAIAAPLDDDTYRSPNNGVTDRPVVADPVGVGMNQAYLRWANDKVTATVGRQEVVFGGSRFVGNVGWRQNHQSFDAARLDYSVSSTVKASYAFIREAHRITGAQQGMRSHVAQATAKLSDIGALTLHATLLDFQNVQGLDTSTFGARFSGSRAISDDLTALFEAAYAMQGDAYDNPADLSANYLNAALGVALQPVTVKVGYELLSGSAEDGAFSTTLATGHKFNGWADQFLGTPGTGLTDLYLTVSTKVKGANLLATYHEFGADSGGARYGSEIDIQATYGIAGKPMFGAKIAHYMADERGIDVTKLWIWTSIRL